MRKTTVAIVALFMMGCASQNIPPPDLLARPQSSKQTGELNLPCLSGVASLTRCRSADLDLIMQLADLGLLIGQELCRLREDIKPVVIILQCDRVVVGGFRMLDGKPLVALKYVGAISGPLHEDRKETAVRVVDGLEKLATKPVVRPPSVPVYFPPPGTET